MAISLVQLKEFSKTLTYYLSSALGLGGHSEIMTPRLKSVMRKLLSEKLQVWQKQSFGFICMQLDYPRIADSAYAITRAGDF